MGRPALATIGQRFGALLLDGLLVSLAMVLVFAAAALLGALLASIADVLAALAAVLALAGWIVVLLGFALLEAGPYGQTPGKHVAGIRVVKVDGRSLTRGQSLGRYACKAFISGSICYLGYLWALWDGERRTWHDMIVETRVVVADGRASSMLEVITAPLTGAGQGGR